MERAGDLRGTVEATDPTDLDLRAHRREGFEDIFDRCRQGAEHGRVEIAHGVDLPNRPDLSATALNAIEQLVRLDVEDENHCREIGRHRDEQAGQSLLVTSSPESLQRQDTLQDTLIEDPWPIAGLEKLPIVTLAQKPNASPGKVPIPWMERSTVSRHFESKALISGQKTREVVPSSRSPMFGVPSGAQHAQVRPRVHFDVTACEQLFEVITGGRLPCAGR
jgi:hypothetical protein